VTLSLGVLVITQTLIAAVVIPEGRGETCHIHGVPVASELPQPFGFVVPWHVRSRVSIGQIDSSGYLANPCSLIVEQTEALSSLQYSETCLGFASRVRAGQHPTTCDGTEHG
jgi:hypothetical protein